MQRRERIPVALTIAGSDSGGGAGVQADLKTFGALRVHGTCVLTCATAQNPKRVLAVQALTPAFVRRQLEAVFGELAPAAVKTGMLYSASIIETVADFLEARRDLRLVVDPVMVSTSGARLLKPGAVKVLCARLLPLATLITPNLEETRVLTGKRVATPEDMRRAAKDLWEQYGCAVLVKGGHLGGGREAVDILRDGRQELLVSAPFTAGVRTHGTGCTYSAAIAGYLARSLRLAEAVIQAKTFVTRAIAGTQRAGRHDVLRFWN